MSSLSTQLCDTSGKSHDNCSSYEYGEETPCTSLLPDLQITRSVRAWGLVPGFFLKSSWDDSYVLERTVTRDTQLFIDTACCVKCLTCTLRRLGSWNRLCRVAARNCGSCGSCGSFLPADCESSHWLLKKRRRNGRSNTSTSQHCVHRPAIGPCSEPYESSLSPLPRFFETNLILAYEVNTAFAKATSLHIFLRKSVSISALTPMRATCPIHVTLHAMLLLMIYRVGQIQALDRVQNKAAKFSYHTNESNWETLTQRRKISRICALFKVYSVERAWKAIGDRSKRHYYPSRADHEREIRNRRQRTDTGKYYFVNRTVRLWNWLAAEILGILPCKPNSFRKNPCKPNSFKKVRNVINVANWTKQKCVENYLKGHEVKWSVVQWRGEIGAYC